MRLRAAVVADCPGGCAPVTPLSGTSPLPRIPPRIASASAGGGAEKAVDGAGRKSINNLEEF